MLYCWCITRPVGFKRLNAHCQLVIRGMKWKVSPLLQCPLMGRLYQPLMTIKKDAYMKHWCNKNEGEGGEVLRWNTVQVSTSSTTKPTYTALQSNPGLRGNESTNSGQELRLVRYQDFIAHKKDCRLADVGIQEPKPNYKHVKSLEKFFFFVIKSWADMRVKKRK